MQKLIVNVQTGEQTLVDMTEEEISALQPEPLTTEQIVKQYQDAVQVMLDAKAREKGYDSVLSACSYAAIANIFQAESQAFIIWRSNVWAHGYQVLADVQNGVIPMPTLEEFLAGLPVYE